MISISNDSWRLMNLLMRLFKPMMIKPTRFLLMMKVRNRKFNSSLMNFSKMMTIPKKMMRWMATNMIKSKLKNCSNQLLSFCFFPITNTGRRDGLEKLDLWKLSENLWKPGPNLFYSLLGTEKILTGQTESYSENCEKIQTIWARPNHPRSLNSSC